MRRESLETSGVTPRFRNWAAIRAAAHERAQAWTRRGKCPRCEFWQYLIDGDPAEHCGGVRLVHLQDRDGHPIT